MSADQLRGAIILIVIATFLYGVRLASQHWSIGTVSMSLPEKKDNIITVEIKGSKGRDGIYSLFPGATVHELFNIARIKHISCFDRRDLLINVHNGDTVIIATKGDQYPSVTVGKMEGTTRYVLGMPININDATVEDLELIPGIGEKTARTIVEYRERNGMFTTFDDVPCLVGKKKSGYLSKYFYIEER
jgi:competence protein ComEA